MPDITNLEASEQVLDIVCNALALAVPMDRYRRDIERIVLQYRLPKNKPLC
jgi:hypothetical protein